MNECPNCGGSIRYAGSEVKLCDDCYASVAPIKLTGRPITLIWDHDWDRLVERVYGKPYQFQQQGAMHRNNSIWTFTVPEDFNGGEIAGVPGEIAEWQAIDHTTFKYEFDFYREHYPDFETLMIDLTVRGLLDPGEYALYISW